MQPAGATSHSPAATACRRTNSTTLTESWAGSVFGIATTAVYPPSAAARAPGLDRLGLLVPRLAQVGVEIDEAGAHDATRGIEHRDTLAVAVEVLADGDDDVAVDQHVGRAFAGLVEHEPVLDHDRHGCTSKSVPLPRMSNSTAIRTAMPFVTCCVITAPGSSDGSTAISTPRFIGPGMHHEGVLAEPARPLRRQAEPRRVLAQRRHQRLGHPLALHAQQVEHVDVVDHVVEVVGRRQPRRPAAATCVARRA